MISKHIIIYSFQSLEDPLLKGLMLEYIIQANSGQEKTNYHLISHEQAHFKLSPDAEKQKMNFLASKNIFWHPVNYKTGEALLLKKLFNFLETFFICLKLKIRHKPKAILGFLPVAGGYSYILSKILSLKLIVFCYEPHSQYMIDFGLWKKNSLRYKLLKKFELLQVQYADYLVVPTTYAYNAAVKLNSKGKIYLTPISIDTSAFKFSPLKRNEIRDLIGAANKTVIIYTGKFGGIYYSSDEVICLFKKLITCSESYFLYIITPNIKETNQSALKFNLPSNLYCISDVVNYEDLQNHISAADIGLVAVPPFPSQKYRTPVKTAIYLSCGLPYIINKGIAEDDIMAEKENVGVVVNDLNTIDAETLHKNITRLLTGSKQALSERCSETAFKYRGIHNSVTTLKEIMEDLF